MIRFSCECGRQLQATEQCVGQEAVCPACGRTTSVPASDQPTRDAAPSAGYSPLAPRRHAIESGPPASARQAEPGPDGGRRRLATAAVVLGGLSLVVLFSALLWRFTRAPRAKDETPPADEQAAKAPPAFTAEQLIKALSDEDPDVRSFAVTSLSLMDLGEEGDAAIAPLTKLLADQRDTTRAAAAAALGRIGKRVPAAVGPAIAGALAPLLSDPDANVRRSAAVALGQVGSGEERAVAALGGALKDPDEDVRHAAAEALGKIGPAARSAVAALQDAARDGDQETRLRATRSLQQIGR